MSDIRPRSRSRRSRTRSVLFTGTACLVWGVMAAGCGGGSGSVSSDSPAPADSPQAAFLDTLQERTFHYFWDLSHPETFLTPDRAPSPSFASVAAGGFALTAYPIGVERGYVTRSAAARRVLDTLRFLWTAPQNDSPSSAAGYHGFYYHFLDPATGLRFAEVELSTVDTALLLAGALFCQSYFDGNDPVEMQIRSTTDSLYARVDWTWAQVRPPSLGHGWDPEGGFLPYDWRGYNEAMIMYILALGSPTHPIGPEAWDEWVSGYRWGEFMGQEHLGFASLFGHHYSHVWIDYRGIHDAFTAERGVDYFENSRRATLAQQAYAVENPGGWDGYGPLLWGLTACDGPVSGTFEIDGRERVFNTYWARGASFTWVNDDGTVAPAAAGGSIAFAPEIVIPTLMSMRETYGDRLFSTYGFLDSFNPTFRADVAVQHGRVDPDLGWFDTDYLGIDQGPILAMTENHRTGLIWRTMRKNPHLIRGLRRAGFTGGWLDSVAVAR